MQITQSDRLNILLARKNKIEEEIQSFYDGIEKDAIVPDIKIFLENLKDYNYRDYLIALVIIETSGRLSSILLLRKSCIDFNSGVVSFIYHSSIVHKKLSESLFSELKFYLEKYPNNTDFVFVTRNFKPLTRSRLNIVFLHVCRQAKIKTNITPEYLRTIYYDSVEKIYKKG